MKTMPSNKVMKLTKPGDLRSLSPVSDEPVAGR